MNSKTLTRMVLGVSLMATCLAFFLTLLHAFLDKLPGWELESMLVWHELRTSGLLLWMFLFAAVYAWGLCLLISSGRTQNQKAEMTDTNDNT